MSTGDWLFKRATEAPAHNRLPLLLPKKKRKVACQDFLLVLAVKAESFRSTWSL